MEKAKLFQALTKSKAPFASKRGGRVIHISFNVEQFAWSCFNLNRGLEFEYVHIAVLKLLRILLLGILPFFEFYSARIQIYQIGMSIVPIPNGYPVILPLWGQRWGQLFLPVRVRYCTATTATTILVLSATANSDLQERKRGSSSLSSLAVFIFIFHHRRTMKVLAWKLVSFTMCICLVILVLPFVSSSQEHVKSINGSHANNKGNIDKVSDKLMFEIKLHGFLLWASMGFLMPVGILAIRMSNREECGRRLKILFYVHAVSQMLSVLLATAGAVMSIKNFNNSFNNHHQRLGATLYGVIWLQALTGVLRPWRGSKGRSAWFFAHWLLGTAVSILGVINIYTGLVAYHEKTSRKIKLWTIVLTAEISLIVFIYLFQDKWLYIQKQGVILGHEPVRPTEQDISSTEKQKEEPATENC
ncbi:hypothetical protein DITRI_Ditri13aG0151300 [Diplodiscus trichospermus]